MADQDIRDAAAYEHMTLLPECADAEVLAAVLAASPWWPAQTVDVTVTGGRL